MDSQDSESAELWAHITALNHLLEHGFALFLSHADDPSEATRKLRENILREFDLPPLPEDDGEAAWLVQQQALSVLEGFFERVQARALPARK